MYVHMQHDELGIKKKIKKKNKKKKLNIKENKILNIVECTCDRTGDNIDVYFTLAVASVSSGCHAPCQCSTVIRVVDFTAMKGTRARNYTNEVINRGKQMIESGRSRTRYNLRNGTVIICHTIHSAKLVFCKVCYDTSQKIVLCILSC